MKYWNLVVSNELKCGSNDMIFIFDWRMSIIEYHLKYMYMYTIMVGINFVSLIHVQPILVFFQCDLANTLGYRMNPYGCIATGREEGMIEIVTNSMTISKIQRWYKKGAFAKEALYEWLKHKNPKEERSDTFILYLNRVHWNLVFGFIYWNILGL